MARKKKKEFKVLDGLLISVLILLISVIGLYYSITNLNFGLDLAGGFEVLYKVESIDDNKVNDEMITNTRKIIEKRIDVLGVSEPEIAVEGNNIRVKLAGVNDIDKARQTISSVANLTFRSTDGTLLMGSEVLKSGQAQAQLDTNGYYISLKISDIDKFYEVTKKVSESEDPYMVIWLDHDENMKLEKGPIGEVYGYYTTDEEGNEIFNACGNLKISNCLSYAGVNEGLSTDTVSLTKQGGFYKEDAEELVELINSGSMPTKLTEISSRTVSASFGEDSLNKTFLAGVIGMLAIVFILILIYRFSGLIASISILTYTFLTLLVFNLVGGRLTLQGIAALVIGVGMAVDSAVISFSRIKEELRNGFNLKNAYINGNKESFTSILDANITTLIAAIILFFLGESSVKGFATMLIISIVITFAIMVYLNRYLIGLFAKTDFFEKHKGMFLGYKENKKENKFNKFSFIKIKKVVYIVVILIILIGGVFTYKKGLNLGIDFKGGSTITINSNKKIDSKSIESDIKKLGYKIDSLDVIDDKIISVNIKDVLDNENTTKVEEYFNAKYESTTSVGSISNEVKKDLASNAVKALIIACIGMIIYTSIRFKFSYGISAIITLIHDSIMVVILFSLLRLEVNSMFIAAILSIIGYSINDTIVIFDRIRENYSKLNKSKTPTKENLEEIVNLSLKQTVGRCLVTTITTLTPVISLILLGSYEIINFNLALLFGLICGTISSLFIAGQIWISFERIRIKNSNKKKWYDDGKKEPEELKVKGVNC